MNVEQQLAHAVDNNNHAGIEDALAKGAAAIVTVKGTSRSGYSAEDNEALLLQSALIGEMGILKKLVVNEKTNVNCCDSSGKTPAINLVMGGNLKHLPLLQKHGADLQIEDRHGKNIAFYAAKYGGLADIIYLESQGIDINHVDDFGMNLLHMVSISEEPKLDMAHYLAMKGIDHKAKNKSGHSPIMLDIAMNKKDKALFNFYMSLGAAPIEQ